MTLYLRVLPERITQLQTLFQWFGGGEKPKIVLGKPDGYIYLEYKRGCELDPAQIDALETIAAIIPEDEALVDVQKGEVIPSLEGLRQAAKDYMMRLFAAGDVQAVEEVFGTSAPRIDSLGREELQYIYNEYIA